jgi:hypothetical protein
VGGEPPSVHTIPRSSHVVVRQAASPHAAVHHAQHAILVVPSLTSILLVILHVSDDIVGGFESGGLEHIQTILTVATRSLLTENLCGLHADGACGG